MYLYVYDPSPLSVAVRVVGELPVASSIVTKLLRTNRDKLEAALVSLYLLLYHILLSFNLSDILPPPHHKTRHPRLHSQIRTFSTRNMVVVLVTQLNRDRALNTSAVAIIKAIASENAICDSSRARIYGNRIGCSPIDVDAKRAGSDCIGT